MDIFVALFRGINVGGNNSLPMNSLASILEEAGCEKVKTYIQSGNAVFCTNKKNRGAIAEEIGSKIQERHGFKPKVLLLEAEELEQAIHNNPFKGADGRGMYFFFLESTPEKPDLEGLMGLKSTSEEFKLIDKVFYLYAPEGIGRSKLAAKIEKALGVPTTGRNWNTTSKLREMARGVEP